MLNGILFFSSNLTAGVITFLLLQTIFAISIRPESGLKNSIIFCALGLKQLRQLLFY